MTPPANASPPTVGQLLFSSPETARDELARAATGSASLQDAAGSVPTLTKVGVRLLGSEIGRMAAGFLDVELSEAIARGWEVHDQLTEARESTAASPGSEVVVPLASHTVRSDYRPSIDVVVDDATIASIQLHLAVATKIDAATAVVRGGDVAALRAGAATVTATLTCEGVTVAEQSTRIDLPGTLHLPPTAPEHLPAGATPDGSAARPAAQGPPPVGLVRDGWRLTAAGTWEPALVPRPGDIVNGYRLNDAGTAWEPWGAPPAGRH